MYTYIIISILVLLAIFLLKPLVLMILLKLKHGKKVEFFYVPIFGIWGRFVKAEKEHKDVMYFERRTILEYPECEVKINNSMEGSLVYIFYRPQHLKQILSEPMNYKKVMELPFGEDYLHKSLLFQKQEDWKNARKIISKHLEFGSLIQRIPYIKEQCKKINPERNIVSNAGSVVGNVISQYFFGEGNNQEFTDALGLVCKGFLTLGVDTPWRYIIRSRFFKTQSQSLPKFLIFNKEKALLAELGRLKDQLNQRIQEKIKNQDFKNDFLSAYIQEVIKQTITVEQVMHQYILLLFAGMDTTSNLLGACCYALAYKEGVQDKLRSEIYKVINNFDEFNGQNMNDIHYLEWFIQEALRLYNPATSLFERIAEVDHYVGNYFIKKGTNVVALLCANGLDPQIYNNPLEFNPDRWKDLKLEPFIFNPFSNGPKHCIGKYLALIEVKCLLVYIVLKYKVVRGLDTEPTWVNRFVYTIKEENFVKLEEIK